MRASDRLRAALALASSVPEPRLERSLGNLGGLLSEAERRRRAAATIEARIVAAGRFWIPRLVPATALLVFAALVWSGGSTGRQASAGGDAQALDRWLVTGSVSETVQDPVADAIFRSTLKDGAR